MYFTLVLQLIENYECPNCGSSATLDDVIVGVAEIKDYAIGSSESMSCLVIKCKKCKSETPLLY